MTSCGFDLDFGDECDESVVEYEGLLFVGDDELRLTERRASLTAGGEDDASCLEDGVVVLSNEAQCGLRIDFSGPPKAQLYLADRVELVINEQCAPSIGQRGSFLAQDPQSTSVEFLDPDSFAYDCTRHELDIWVASDFVHPNTGARLDFDAQALLVDGYFDTKLIAECSG